MIQCLRKPLGWLFCSSLGLPLLITQWLLQLLTSHLHRTRLKAGKRRTGILMKSLIGEELFSRKPRKGFPFYVICKGGREKNKGTCLFLSSSWEGASAGQEREAEESLLWRNSHPSERVVLRKECVDGSCRAWHRTTAKRTLAIHIIGNETTYSIWSLEYISLAILLPSKAKPHLLQGSKSLPALPHACTIPGRPLSFQKLPRSNKYLPNKPVNREGRALCTLFT